MAMDVGEPEVATRVPVGQTLVIDTEQREHRRVEIVDVDLVFECVEAVLVGRAVGESRLDAPPPSTS